MHTVAEIALNRYTDSAMRVWMKMKAYLPARVAVPYRKIEDTAAAMAAEEMKIPDWKLPGVFPEDHRAFVTHNFWLNTVNFAFTHFGGKHNKYQLPRSPMFVGAFACAAALTRGFKHCEQLLAAPGGAGGGGGGRARRGGGGRAALPPATTL